MIISSSILLFFLVFNIGFAEAQFCENVVLRPYFETDSRPYVEYSLHNLSELWPYFGNFGIYGGMFWPGETYSGYLSYASIIASAYGEVTPSAALFPNINTGQNLSFFLSSLHEKTTLNQTATLATRQY